MGTGKLVFVIPRVFFVLLVVFVSGCVEKPLEGPTESSPIIGPSQTSLWAESEVGQVYAQETHYARPSPDGRYLYVFNMDSRNIIVLDIENRTVIGDIKMPGFWAQATGMVFSSDGRWMYTLSAGLVGNRNVVVIDTNIKKIDRLIPLPEECETVFASNGPFIALSPDGQFLYVPSFNGICSMNIESGQFARISDIGRIAFLVFTPEGRILGANTKTNSLDIIDPDTGGLIDSIPVGNSPQYILISPDGQRAYVSNWESGDVAVVDIDARNVITTIPVGVNPLGMAITPDGQKFYVAVTAQALEHAAGEPPSKVVVVDTANYTVVKEIMPGWSPRFVNISPDGTRIYAGDSMNRIYIIDTASDELTDSVLLVRPTTYVLGDIAITPDGSRVLVSANGIHQVLVIDTATHALLDRFDASSNAIAISPDGKRAYVPGVRFAVIDIPSLTARYTDMPGIEGGSLKIDLSKDERIAYIADSQRDILQVVDLENWRLIANIPVGNMGDPEFDLAVTPDGKKVFVCNGYSKDISVVSTAENRVIDTIKMESTPVGIDISPDGRVAYVIELQSEVRGFTHVVAIDVATHKVIQRWAHEPVGFGNPWEVAVSPDGKRAYFGGVDGEIVVILDIGDGATRYIEVGLDPFNIALTEDGRRLYVSNTNSDDITVIDTQTEKVVDIIPIQIEGMGFVYATITDRSGRPVSIEIPVGFTPYDQGVKGDFNSTGFAARHPRLTGYWIPVPEGDYMLWVSTNRGNMRFVGQIYDGISDSGKQAKASRVRVRKGRITSVNFVLQEGHRVSGVLADQEGNPVSTGGTIVNTRTGASISGCIGFGSGKDGRFQVNVPEGVYDLSFGGIGVVARGIAVHGDVDLGELTFQSR
jgi:YVTN family beta-propeller protein